ncbi:MAG TPA: cupin domain-containing protein [Chitinophagaceae bacterium]
MKTAIILSIICVAVLITAYGPRHGRNTAGEKAEVGNFSKPDEVREFPKGRLELIKIGGATIGRAIFQPGWKWSTSLQPLVKTQSCEAPHFQYHVSGVLAVKMDDGTVFECKPGDVSLLPHGHDGWVVGNEPAVVVDFQGMIDYAKAK